MTTRPSSPLRRQVVDRANGCCEYCLIHESLVASTHQVDHVTAEKHGGATTLSNLALSCTTCNLRKASDIASLDPDTGLLVALYNPREQLWAVHFALEAATLTGLTPAGRTTIEFLQLNSDRRRVERAALILAGLYPHTAGIRKPK